MEDSPGSPAVITDGGRLLRVPNAPATPLKCFRVPEELYRRALAKARSEGKSASDVVRECLAAYVAESSDDPEPERDGES